jgi:hypothetical protein
VRKCSSRFLIKNIHSDRTVLNYLRQFPGIFIGKKFEKIYLFILSAVLDRRQKIEWMWFNVILVSLVVMFVIRK